MTNEQLAKDIAAMIMQYPMLSQDQIETIILLHLKEYRKD
jgi:hypothetical protein